MSHLISVRRVMLVAFAVCLTASTVYAQGSGTESLEQTYGRLCGNGQQSDTCAALHAGLTAKLGGTSSQAQTPASGTAMSTERRVAVPNGWGFFGQLAGSSWVAPSGNLYSYEWQEPGTVLAVEVITTNETRNNTLVLSPDGASILLRTPAASYTMQPVGDGSFFRREGSQRFRQALEGQKLITAVQAVEGGVWTTLEERRRLAPEEIVATKSALAQHRARPAAAPVVLPGATSLKPAAPTGVWGFYSSLVGSKVLLNGKVVRMDALRSLEGDSNRAVGEYEWLESNRVLATRTRIIGQTIPSDVHFTYDIARGGIEMRDLAASAGTLWKIEADGSLLMASAGEGWRSEARTTVVDDSTLRMTTLIEGSALTAASRSETILHFTRITDAEAQALVPTEREKSLASSLDALLADAAAKKREREVAAAAAANPKKGRGGLLRAAIGAGLGVAAGNASGMDATQTLGAAAKGVALMNPDSKVAQVVGASGDAVLQSSGLGTAPAGTAAGSSASYPTKPNALNGQAACSMMNESNYRQVGVSGGNDVQLKTMCAQAFEYYTMYKRAIAQGYSEADANRTYSAHQQAAQNAIAFYANNRAQ